MLVAEPPATITTVAEFFRHHDAGRVPTLLPKRYRRKKTNALAFFRGSAPLYYTRFRTASALADEPAGWLCGDAHIENYGSYRGDNGLVYFDLNDFDEALLGPLGWDVGRLLVSARLAAAAALDGGKPYLLKRATARARVQQLLKTVAHRRQRELLAGRVSHRSSWRLRSRHVPALRPLEHQAVLRTAEAWRRAQPTPRCGPLLEVAGRIAGVGSLDVLHYALLAHSRQPGRLPRLLDLKFALPAAPAVYCLVLQPARLSEAARTIVVQGYLQATYPALLQPLELAGRPFVLRALQPVTDKLDFYNFTCDAVDLRAAPPTFGHLLAWAYLRAAGYRGAAGPDALRAFGAATRWQNNLLVFATEAQRVVVADYVAFARACRAGEFTTTSQSA